MRLADLHPRFWQLDDEGRATDMPTARAAHGALIDCPCGCPVTVFLHFANPIGVAPQARAQKQNHWTRSGETAADLTLSPSVLLHGTPDGPCKGWHGFITNGEVRSC